MKAFRNKVYDLYRRWFGSYLLDDPRARAEDAPYTFYMPPTTWQKNVQPGDSVQLIFISHPKSLETGAERMWVEVTEVHADRLIGKLDNNPFDMPQLRPGDCIEFQSYHIIGIQTDRLLPEDPGRKKQYWDRCMVDQCVIYEGVPVYYVYREEPDMGQPEDNDPDSGWRIRGDYRNLSDEQLEARKASYVALGSVLNTDDSWLHLIDEPIGSAFIRNFDTGEYEVYDRASHD